MSKLYIFGIGGTGSRVLRSFTMLMAAGVRLGNNINAVVPIIIDPDQSNADLTRVAELISKYWVIRSGLTFVDANPNWFFRTEMCQVKRLDVVGTSDKTLKQFVDLASMDKQSEAMMRMLFSEKNLNSGMDVGFKGNPNIGSVVLNQIVKTHGFEDFANLFQQGDIIFIISSIFGGTGAAGFPLLIKTLRQKDAFANSALVNKADIGAVTVLPYFKIKADVESEIDSSTFISKTKSALAYYENNIVKNNSLNALYYLADEMSGIYENHEGGIDQQNNAHLIEFLAATAIVDFTFNTNSLLQGNNSITTSNREFGIRDSDSNTVTFLSFCASDQERLYQPLTQFMLLSLCMTDEYNYFTSKNFNAYVKYFKSIEMFIREVREFSEKYKEWLEEMKGNKRSLDLFNLKCGKKPFEVVTGVKETKILNLKSNYSLVADRLNCNVENCVSKNDKDRLLEMYYRGTEQLINEKLKLK